MPADTDVPAMVTGARRLRLLLIAPRMRYLNPTTELILDALGAIAECVPHGPGFSPEDSLAHPIPEVLRRRGPFDAILVHQYFAVGNLAAAASACWLGFDLARFLRAFPAFPAALDDVGVPVVALCTMIDQYAMPSWMRDRLEAFPGTIITWPRDSYDPDRVLSDADGAVIATREFASFSTDNARRIIPVHHVVGRADVVPADAPGRAPAVAIPGHLYVRRRGALRRLKQEGLLHRSVTQNLLRVALKLAGGRMLRHRGAITALRAGYTRVLGSAAIAAVDGSVYDLPVRKYVEVPAAGCAMLAYPCAGINGMGHVAGETFLELAGNDDVIEHARALLADAPRRLALAARGQAMVLARHTGEVRARQIAACLSAIIDGHYAGATWRAGELVLDTAAP